MPPDEPAGPIDPKFDAERKRQMKRLPAIQEDTFAEVGRLLDQASDEIQGVLNSAPTDYQSWSLPNLQQSIGRAGAALAEDMAAAGRDAADRGWRAGVDLIDEPVRVAFAQSLSALLGEVDTRQLMAMRSFLTAKMKDVATETINRINSELGLVMIGARSPSEAVQRVDELLGGDAHNRAVMTLRTEVGRAYSMASAERMAQAKEAGVKVQKQWRRSGKRHSRISHDVADGQVQDIDQPFKVGGTTMMYPRDPKAPAKETINCGCCSLPYMSSWEVSHPRNRPMTKDELDGSETKRRLGEVRSQAYASWIRRLDKGTIRAAGSAETVGTITPTLARAVQARGVDLKSTDIGISDRRVVHMLRDAKRARKQAVPAGLVQALPAHLANPRAVLWDRSSSEPQLIYVVDVPGQKRLAKVAVKLRKTDTRARHRTENAIVTGGMVDAAALRDGNVYEVLEGRI